MDSTALIDSFLNSFSSEDFIMRKLEIEDYNKESFESIISNPWLHQVIVIEERKSGKLVATGCIYCEQKFIRDCGRVGRIEDIVVGKECRGKGVGKTLITILKTLAFEFGGAYKVTLDCSNEVQVFYEKQGFVKKENHMAMSKSPLIQLPNRLPNHRD